MPVGTIPQSTFEKYASNIRSFDSIRLGDIPADHKDDKARFIPNPLSTGHIQLSFPTHPPPRSHIPLSLFRPSHFPLAVIGIAACTKVDSLASMFAQFNTSLADIFHPDGVYPLAKNCFVFEEGDEANLNIGSDLPGLVVIPSVMGNKKVYIGTLLADLCSQILGEFGVVAQALETPFGNEYLNSTTLPTMPFLSDIPTPLNGMKKDTLPPLPSQHSQADTGKPSFTLSAAPSTRRTSSINPHFRHPNASVPPVRKRLSSIGVASSHARLFKVLGDLFLLAGRPDDAQVWYTEAIQLFKSSQDVAWYAAALEGIATVSMIEAWSAGNGLNNSATASAKEPWADVSEKLSQATALYYKSPTADGEPNYPLLSYLYTSCVLRHSSFLFAIWSAKGWGPLAFTTMLQPAPTLHLPPTLFIDENARGVSFERLSSISGISRWSITAVLAQVHGPWLLHLGARERIAVLQAMARLYACLGYPRKEAYVLREVLGCILDLIVCGREEDGFSKMSSVPFTAGLGIKSLGPGLAAEWSGVGVRLSEVADGNESILKLLTYVCQVLGINLDAVRLVETNEEGFSASSSAELALASSEDPSDGNLEPYGWPEIQVGVVREAVAVAEALPDFPAVAQFALSALKTLQAVLSPGDQYHLYSTSARALTTARRRGDNKYVEYWSGSPVMSVTVVPLPLVRLPIETPTSTLQSRASDVTPTLIGGTDPFLYNPRKIVGGHGKSLVVQNEVVEFVLMLQNPYIFDLELQSLSLSTSGVPFDSRPIQVLIPATAVHQIVLSGKALQPGTLTLRGCYAQAPSGNRHEFVLPISTDEEEEQLSRKKSMLLCETGRSKYSGIECFPWEKKKRRMRTQLTSTTTIANSPRFLECKVVPEQPLLRIRRTSVTHGAVMLYDGETSSIRITLENVSHLPIDFLRLVFDDSTIIPAQQALAEGTLSVFDTYETEHSLIHNPVFSWDQRDANVIHPGQKLTVTVKCIGKVGCNHGTVHFSYAYVQHPKAALDAEVFHVRQLSYPVMVTVYHMLECHGMDILPFSRHSSELDDQTARTCRDELDVDDEGGWCLFSIEVRNTYGLPFDVAFERVQEGVPPVTTSLAVPPGSMSRIVIPIKKLLLSEEQLSKPIPTLSDRQFVVQKSQLSDKELRTQLELFWYREELFKCVRGRWRETGGIRSGELSLRQQRMTQPMVKTLRMEEARVHMSLVSYNPSHGTDKLVNYRGGKYYPAPQEFVYLRIKITNLSPSPLIFTVDLEVEPAEHVVHEGVLTDLAIGRLGGGESTDVETALCFITYGYFEILAQVSAFDASRIDSRAGLGRLIAIVEDDNEK